MNIEVSVWCLNIEMVKLISLFLYRLVRWRLGCENGGWVPSKHALWLSSNELCVLSRQMSSGSLTAHWLTRPSWWTLVWCPCLTPLLVSSGHILWMLHGLSKVQASVIYTKYSMLVCHWETPYSQLRTVLTCLASFVIINSLLIVVEWTTTGYFSTGTALTLWLYGNFCTRQMQSDIFLSDKSWGRFIQQHRVF